MLLFCVCFSSHISVMLVLLFCTTLMCILSNAPSLPAPLCPIWLCLFCLFSFSFVFLFIVGLLLLNPPKVLFVQRCVYFALKTVFLPLWRGKEDCSHFIRFWQLYYGVLWFLCVLACFCTHPTWDSSCVSKLWLDLLFVLKNSLWTLLPSSLSLMPATPMTSASDLSFCLYVFNLDIFICTVFQVTNSISSYVYYAVKLSHWTLNLCFVFLHSRISIWFFIIVSSSLPKLFSLVF